MKTLNNDFVIDVSHNKILIAHLCNELRLYFIFDPVELILEYVIPKSESVLLKEKGGEKLFLDKPLLNYLVSK